MVTHWLLSTVYNYLETNKKKEHLEKVIISLYDKDVETIKGFNVYYKNMMNHNEFSDSEECENKMLNEDLICFDSFSETNNETFKFKIGLTTISLVIGDVIEYRDKTNFNSLKNLSFSPIQDMINYTPNEQLKDDLISSLFHANDKNYQNVSYSVTNEGFFNVINKQSAKRILEALAIFASAMRHVLKLKTVKIIFDNNLNEKEEIFKNFCDVAKILKYDFKKAERKMKEIKNQIDSSNISNRKIKKIKFELVSDDQIKIDKAIEHINKSLNSAKSILFIDNDAIKTFKDEQIEEIRRKCLSIKVGAIIDKQIGKIKLDGMKEKVFQAIMIVNNLIADYAAILATKARKICENVQWEYSKDNINWQPFNVYLNEIIENKFKISNEQNYFTIPEFDDYEEAACTIDFKNSKIFDASTKVEIFQLRRNVAKSENIDIKIPSVWDKTKECELVSLDSTTDSIEYKEVLDVFNGKQFGGNIIKIQRVQNLALYIQYQAHKKHFEKRDFNEKTLFHGTNSTSVSSIWTTGFNRSYAGLNNTRKYNYLFTAKK